VLRSIFDYLADLIAKWPRARPILAWFRLLRIKLRAFLNAHPLVALLAFVGVGTVLVAGPVWIAIETLREPQRCYTIATRHKELYTADGDVLKYGDERPCEHGQMVGFEFLNWGPVRFNEQATPIDLVSAGIFIKETAQNVKGENQWHEYSVFAHVNDFTWNAHGPPIFQDSFLEEGCGYDPTDASLRGKTQGRQGLLLRSDQMRSNPKLDRSTWRQCNYGSHPEQPIYRICDYVYLEFFIPSIAPEQWCSKTGSNSLKNWIGGGTTKVTMLPPGAYDELRSLARDRWVETTARPVSKERWDALSRGMPKICMRWMGPKDEWLGQLSYWDEFASIPAVWCDN
jgi:hypothetical protein